MKINVKIKSRLNYLNMDVDTEKASCEINQEKCEVNADSVALRLYAYTHNWPENISNSNFMDGEKYRVIVESEKGKKVYTGENAFPENYSEFKDYIYGIKRNHIIEEKKRV